MLSSFFGEKMNFNLIMENWRVFLKEQESQSSPARASAIIWNNPDYKPVDEIKKDSPLLKTILPENIPQGHAGIVLLKELKDNRVLAVSCNFGIGGTQCPKAEPKGPVDIIRNKIGLFVNGGVKIKTTTVPMKENFFDMKDKTSSIIYILENKSKILRTEGAKQFGLVPSIDFNSASTYAKTPKCRLYTIMPQMGGSKGDNCGSYALKVAAAGIQGPTALQSGEAGGASSQAAYISEQFIGPTDMLPILLELGWVTVAKSF